MSELFIIRLGQQMMLDALIISLPLLGIGLVVGVLISIFQAATQINEQTLTIVPKLLIVGATIIVIMPWLIQKVKNLTLNLFEMIPRIAQ